MFSPINGPTPMRIKEMPTGTAGIIVIMEKAETAEGTIGIEIRICKELIDATRS